MDAEQKRFDFTKSEQERLLRDCRIGSRRDPKGVAISADKLKSILTAIHRRYPNAYPSISLIAEDAELKVRTTERGLRILKEMGLLLTQPLSRKRTLKNAYPVNRYTIVWSEVALLCTQPLWRAKGQGAAADEQGAAADEQGAAADEQGAASGARRSKEVPKEEVNKMTSTSGGVDFSLDDVAAIECRVRQILFDRRGMLVLVEKNASDRELLLKIATLEHRGRIQSGIVAGIPDALANRPAGVTAFRQLWGVMRRQCREKQGEEFESLLKSTDFPRELLGKRLLPLDSRETLATYEERCQT